jgi:hypothetical protein
MVHFVLITYQFIPDPQHCGQVYYNFVRDSNTQEVRLSVPGTVRYSLYQRNERNAKFLNI